MAEHDPVGERLLGRLRETLGEPEATMLMDRFATRDDVRRVEHSVELLRRDLVAEVRGLHAEIHKVARQQLLTFLTVCLSVFGVFNAAMLAILKLT
jgi:deoxyribodipyrimidine photolyase-like uncharacterized protein